jgi:carbamoylphosphate synthase large subunit
VAQGFESLIPKIGRSQNYPYILKKKIDAWGKNSHVISNKQQEQAFSHLLESTDYFCQEFIPGRHEYATHILVKDGRIVCSLNIKYTFDSCTPIKGKDQPAYLAVSRCPYLELFSDILNAIGFEGLCCINYKAVDGHPYVFEINPRFGGSLCKFFPHFLRHLNPSPGNNKQPCQQQ